jgi:hypothetical protein
MLPFPFEGTVAVHVNVWYVEVSAGEVNTVTLFTTVWTVKTTPDVLRAVKDHVKVAPGG